MKRHLSLARKIWDSNFERLAHPYKLTYVVTKECHSKCLNCDIWKVKPKNELTLEEVEKFFKANPYFSWIDFTGGEPTDRQDFVQVVKAAIDNSPDLLLIHFPTNGLKPKRVEAVCQELVKFKETKLVVTVSIDGPPEVNDRLRGIPKDFQRAVETYSMLSKIPRMKVFVGMTLYSENVNLVEQTVEAIQKILPDFSWKDIHVNIPHVSSHYYENKATNPQPSLDMVKAIEGLMKRRRAPISPFAWIEHLYQKRVQSYVETGVCPQKCATLLSSCFLAEEGTLYPCIIWSEKLGNIRDTNYSLEPLLKSIRAGELREQLIANNCPNCWTPCEAYQTILGNIFTRN